MTIKAAWDMSNVSMHWEDLQCLVERKVHENGLSIKYTIIQAWAQKRIVYMEGNVKWDGCSDWYFGEETKVVISAGSKT